MTEVLLTHSYFLHFDPKEFRAMMPYPPLGTLYAASYLRRRGISVALHDVMLAEREEEIGRPIQAHSPRLVAIYDDGFNYLSKMCLSRMRKASFKMASLAKQQGSRVVVFSSDASDHLQEYFAQGADYVICGEAEVTLGELADHLLGRSSQSLYEINGIAFVRDGEIIRTPRRRLLQNLDALPFPAWDLVDLEMYRRVWRKRHGYFSLNIATTRGCPFHCNWCAKPIYGQVYHSRSPHNVVEEMLYLKEFARPDHIWFADDIFGLKPGWIAAFDESVAARNAKIPFKCLSRVDLLLQEDNIRHLKNAGCQTVWVGAESGSQKILDAMEKGTTVAQIYEAANVIHRNGIRVGFFLQYGYPGETREDIEKTLLMVKACKPDEIGISVSYPLPGTRFYERVKEELERKQNWIDSGDLDMMFRGTFSSDFYRALHKLTHKKFRVWQAGELLRAIAGRPAALRRSTLTRLLKSTYHFVTLPAAESRLEALAKHTKSATPS
jgi:radical SAM superfamily enzyme YgiQ (UPF0313 family)